MPAFASSGISLLFTVCFFAAAAIAEMIRFHGIFDPNQLSLMLPCCY
jgi:hypothetical protein